MRFTSSNVLKLSAPKDKSDVTIWDERMPGFGIRFRNQGAGIYVIQYSIGGKQAKMAIGPVAKVTLDFAQTEAKKHFALIAQGKSPIDERIRESMEAGERFEAMIPAFILELSAGKPGRKPRVPSYIGPVKRSLNVHFASLHGCGLGAITRKKIVAELERIEKESGFRAAGTAQAHLSSYYGFCIRKGYEGLNPVHGTERRNSQRRERFHSPEELALIWRATEEPTRFNRIVRLLMLTAMRKTVIGSLKRHEVNRKDRVIEIGLEIGKAKNGQEFLLPMSRQVEAMVIQALERTNLDYVFGDGAVDTKGGFGAWSSKVWLDKRIKELNGGQDIPPWVLHDFRRTFRTLAVEHCDIADNIADVCLYHVGEAKKGLNGTYNKATYLDKKRDAMQRWADYIEQIVTKPEQQQAA